MSFPIINNHLKQQYILIGDEKSVLDVYSQFEKQRIKVAFVCYVPFQKDEKSISLEECEKICKNNSAFAVIGVSNNSIEIVSSLADKGINAISLSSFLEPYINQKRACHLEEMYIDSKGDVYCCCKTYLGNRIGNLSEHNIDNKILNYTPSQSCRCVKGVLSSALDANVPNKVKLASIELSNACNARCLYCFQNGSQREKQYNYFKELETLIGVLNIPNLMFAGGEILTQKDSMAFIKQLRSQYPAEWIHLKTNGCVTREKCEYVSSVFDSVTVTLNGFSESTYRSIMNIHFDKVKDFCEELAKKEVSLGLKFLCSPANISELPEFLKWSINLNPDRIIVPCARIYTCQEGYPDQWKGSSFDGLNKAYWEMIFTRTGKEVSKILPQISPKTEVRFDKEIKSILSL